MSVRILGIGLGLFLLLLLWSITLVVLIVTRRANNSATRTIGLLVLAGASVLTCLLLLIPRVTVDHASEQLDEYTNFWHLQISRYLKSEERAKSASSLSQSSREPFDSHNGNEKSEHNWKEPDLPVDGLHLVRWLLMSITLLTVVAVALLLFALVVERAIQRPKLAEMVRSARTYTPPPVQAGVNVK